MKQTFTIENWLPAPAVNSGAGTQHWSRKRKRTINEKTVAYMFAKAAGWTRVDIRARLTITLVFPKRRERDTDNLYSRVKATVDGLKDHFFVDDSKKWLELIVEERVERGRKATIFELEEISG